MTDPADFCIGEEATSHGSGAHWPIRHGMVENWSHMERFWQQSIHRHGRRALSLMHSISGELVAVRTCQEGYVRAPRSGMQWGFLDFVTPRERFHLHAGTCEWTARSTTLCSQSRR